MEKRPFTCGTSSLPLCKCHLHGLHTQAVGVCVIVVDDGEHDVVAAMLRVNISRLFDYVDYVVVKVDISMTVGYVIC